MKKVKIIAAALIATCAFEYAAANTGINSLNGSVRIISHKDYALRDTVPVTGSKSKTPTTTPMPTTPMPTTPTPMPTPVPSPSVPPAPTPATPTPNPTPAPTPVTPTAPPVK